MIAAAERTRTRGRAQENAATKRCGVYIRVSTEMQVDRNSLSTQESQLLSYAQLHGWQVAKVFTDAGLSAKDTRRPALQEMLRWAKEGKLNIILVSKIDRISRNLIDLLNLIDDLKDWGVDFVSASQSFDTSTPMGMLILNILGSFAQFEREMTAERVRENMRERAKSGAWSGGITPFGYRMNPETKVLEIVPQEVETVTAIFETYRQSRSIRKTIFTMNATRRFNREGKPWARTTIRRILTNPVYVGTVRYAKRAVRGNRILKQDKTKWVVAENACQPIVEKELFADLQAGLNDNTRPRAWREASTYLLTGLVRCGICGGRMNGTTCKGSSGKPHRYYHCIQRVQRGPSVCKGISCKAEELEAAVVGQIMGFDAATLKSELEEHKRRFAEEAAPRAARLAELRQAFEGFRERERRLLELYETGAVDLATFKERRGQLESQRLAVAAELTELECASTQGGEQDIDPDALVRDYRQLQATFRNLSPLEQQRLLQAMTREVSVLPDRTANVHFTPVAGVHAPTVKLDQYVEIQLARQGDER